MKIAIIGTNGIPAKYGGFETLVEYLAEYLADDLDITVFCSSKLHSDRPNLYKGVKLVYIGLSANGWQSILYDFLSLCYSYIKYDKILILGCSGSLFQPLFYLYRHKFIMNLGGLDWQRSKWNFLTRKYLKLSEWFAVKFSGRIISDNVGIQEYLNQEYNVNSTVIAYGGDQVFKVSPVQADYEKYKFLQSKYAFTVARIQPDNNIDILLEAFIGSSVLPLVFVGNWSVSKYGLSIREKYKNHNNLILLDAIYNQRELNLLRSNCFLYLHGHSAGGTNPALVEAMNLGLAILAFDNSFNRYTTANKAHYFRDVQSLISLLNCISIDEILQNSRAMNELAKSEYTWSKISKDYLSFFLT